MKKDILTETLFLRKKDKKHQKKNLVVNLLELIQVMQKNGYDSDYEVNGIEAFIDEFQNKKIKEVKDENKELKDKNKELEEKLEHIEKELKEKEKEAGIKKLKDENKKLKKKIKNLTTNLINNLKKLMM